MACFIASSASFASTAWCCWKDGSGRLAMSRGPDMIMALSSGQVCCIAITDRLQEWGIISIQPCKQRTRWGWSQECEGIAQEMPGLQGMLWDCPGWIQDSTQGRRVQSSWAILQEAGQGATAWTPLQAQCCGGIPHICHFFYTHTFWGMKILHWKVRKFTTKVALRQNSVNHSVKLHILRNIKHCV